MINRTFDNRYTILERIGGGGMADVYRAHDNLLDRSVAVKVLRSQFTDDDEFVTRFRREAQAAARLSHPNIVNIYDVGRDNDAYYIIMEYISGETLKERIQREGSLPVETAIRFALEIAEALEHAHQNNLVHCDIKSHNILTTKAGRAKVTDFGIARAVTAATMTQTGTVVGSVHYFSPEQAKGVAVSAKSDIYSLGVVLFEMLTGTVPFNGETPISIALKHLQEEPPLPRSINPAIPPLLEAIVLKAMAKNPEQRFADIGEMIDDLKLAQNYMRDDHTRRLSKEDFPTQVLPRVPLNDKYTVARPVENVLPLWRKRWFWVLLGLLLIGFSVGAFLAFGKFWSLSEVTVPNVVGKQAEAAKTIITNENLRVSVSMEFNDKIPAGIVISQNPEAGTTVKEQRTVNIVVSKGVEVAVVPELKGLSRRDAELQIKNAGLVLGRVDEQFAADAPQDTVISQNPRPSAQVNKGTTIDLVVSKGAGPRKTVLPDFRGTPLNTVTTQLESLKLKLGTVSETPSNQYPAGSIIGQNPAAGTEVLEGATIDLNVAKNVSGGSGGATKRAVVQITVPDGAVRQIVQIVVTDTGGRRVVYENPQKPGDRIEQAVEGVGQVRVQVYINGALLQEQLL
ncbi:MAG: prkC [Firmicutes bacterium]|nr:prkC [Bacillota bacterium]